MLMSQRTPPLAAPPPRVLTQVLFGATIETVERALLCQSHVPRTRRGSRSTLRIWLQQDVSEWLVNLMSFRQFFLYVCTLAKPLRSYSLAGCVEDNPMLVTVCEKLGFWCYTSKYK